MMTLERTLKSKPFFNWMVVLLLLTAATVVSFLLDKYVSLTSLAMFYVLAVVVAAYTLPRAPSVVTAFGAVTALNFFFVPPRWTFEVEGREHLIAVFTMLAVALVISRLAAALRREAEVAHINEGRARQLQQLATALAGATRSEEVAASGQKVLDAAFAGPCIIAVQEHGEIDAPPALRDGMLCCMRDRATLGPGTGRWPGLNAWYLPLGEQGDMSGAVCIQNVSAADNSGREHAQALCALISQALSRQKLSRSMQSVQEESQRRHLQSTFLAAISHDLRTPLATVVGAASSLLTQRDKLGPQEQERLLGSIVSEAKYLVTVTENTLQLVRLDSSGELNIGWESMEEIVGAVLARVRQRDPQRRIRSQVPAQLPLIKADPVLLAQLLENLLDNALKYSEDTIELEVHQGGHVMDVCINDRGPGIAESDAASIFEPYRRNDRSGQRGAGLGLAVCRAIATAHQGTLTVASREGGGSRFMLTLPVEPAQPHQEAA